MMTGLVSRRVFLRSSTTAGAGLILSPAIIGRAQAGTLKLKCSSSLPNDPKYANGRVYYDNLVKNLKANGLAEQIDVTFFPDNQLGQEIDVINSVKLGVSGAAGWDLRPRLSLHELSTADQGVRRRRSQADRGRAAQGRQHPDHRLGL